MKEVIVKMAQRIYTAQEWISNNPCLLKGEMGVESDTSLFKFGDGETLWVDLPYARTVIDLSVDETSDNPVSGAAVADQLKLKQDKIRIATILFKASEWVSKDGNASAVSTISTEDSTTGENLGTIMPDSTETGLGIIDALSNNSGISVDNLSEDEYLGTVTNDESDSGGSDDNGSSGGGGESGGSGCGCDHTVDIDPLAPYIQAVDIQGLLENERVDLYPSLDIVQYLIESGIGLMVINDGGEATAVAYNHKPSQDLSIEAVLTKI